MIEFPTKLCRYVCLGASHNQPTHGVSVIKPTTWYSIELSQGASKHSSAHYTLLFAKHVVIKTQSGMSPAQSQISNIISINDALRASRDVLTVTLARQRARFQFC